MKITIPNWLYKKNNEEYKKTLLKRFPESKKIIEDTFKTNLHLGRLVVWIFGLTVTLSISSTVFSAMKTAVNETSALNNNVTEVSTLNLLTSVGAFIPIIAIISVALFVIGRRIR